jgi:hypothetical protein
VLDYGYPEENDNGIIYVYVSVDGGSLGSYPFQASTGGCKRDGTGQPDFVFASISSATCGGEISISRKLSNPAQAVIQPYLYVDESNSSTQAPATTVELPAGEGVTSATILIPDGTYNRIGYGISLVGHSSTVLSGLTATCEVPVEETPTDTPTEIPTDTPTDIPSVVTGQLSSGDCAGKISGTVTTDGPAIVILSTNVNAFTIEFTLETAVTDLPIAGNLDFQDSVPNEVVYTLKFGEDQVLDQFTAQPCAETPGTPTDTPTETPGTPPSTPVVTNPPPATDGGDNSANGNASSGESTTGNVTASCDVASSCTAKVLPDTGSGMRNYSILHDGDLWMALLGGLVALLGGIFARRRRPSF